jgi:hypothetical protein
MNQVQCTIAGETDHVPFEIDNILGILDTTIRFEPQVQL